jgi:tetratricopeptide (TPR) repeat protein
MSDIQRLDFIPIFIKANNAFTAGRNEEALELYEEALALNPDYYQVYTMMGRAYKKMGDTDRAIVCYKRSLELKPDQPDTLVRLGKAFEKKGMPVQAEAAYDMLGDIDKKGRYKEITSASKSRSKSRRRRAKRNTSLSHRISRGIKKFFGIRTSHSSKRNHEIDEDADEEQKVLDEIESEENEE